jgi:hypothetical protein
LEAAGIISPERRLESMDESLKEAKTRLQELETTFKTGTAKFTPVNGK